MLIRGLVSSRCVSVASFCLPLLVVTGVSARGIDVEATSRASAPAGGPSASAAPARTSPSDAAPTPSGTPAPRGEGSQVPASVPPTPDATGQWPPEGVLSRPIGPQLAATGSHVEAASKAPAASTAAAQREGSVGVSAAEGIYARSNDGAFSMKVGTVVQLRFNVSSTTDPSRRVEFVPVLARLYAQGTLGAPWIRFYLQPEFAGQQSPEPVAPIAPAPRLLDAWVEAQPSEWIGIRMGMMRPLFSRSWINGLQRALLFDRSDANLFFRTHGPIQEVSGPNVEPTLFWDRDIGATIMGDPLDGVLEYSLGVYNGNGSWFGRNADSWVMPMARLAVNPLGSMGYDETLATSAPDASWKFQVAVGAYENRYRVDYVNAGFESEGTEEQRTLEADITMAGAGVYVSAEGYLRSRRLTNGETSEERGATGQVGWMFWAPYLEAAVRASYIDPNRDSTNDLRQVLDAQINYYHFANNLKLGLRYSWSNNQALVLGGVPGAPAMVAAGTSVNSVSLLTQVYF